LEINSKISAGPPEQPQNISDQRGAKENKEWMDIPHKTNKVWGENQEQGRVISGRTRKRAIMKKITTAIVKWKNSEKRLEGRARFRQKAHRGVESGNHNF